MDDNHGLSYIFFLLFHILFPSDLVVVVVVVFVFCVFSIFIRFYLIFAIGWHCELYMYLSFCILNIHYECNIFNNIQLLLLRVPQSAFRFMWIFFPILFHFIHRRSFDHVIHSFIVCDKVFWALLFPLQLFFCAILLLNCSARLPFDCIKQRSTCHFKFKTQNCCARILNLLYFCVLWPSFFRRFVYYFFFR